MSGDDSRLRDALVRAGRRLRSSGLVRGAAGNLSARLPDGSVLVTPRGSRKDALAPADLVRVEARWVVADDPGTTPEDGSGRLPEVVTTEWAVHRSCYASPAVGAVVHTHAPALTGLALRHGERAGVVFGERLPEIASAVGGVQTVPFAPSGSEELAIEVERGLATGAAVLLLYAHGTVTVGPDLATAVDRTEVAEQGALAILLSR